MTAAADERGDALVVFQPSGRRGRVSVGTTVLDAARELGVHVESVCGGRGICGRCQIETTTGRFAKHNIVSTDQSVSEAGPTELRYAEKRDLPKDRRLSCQARILGDLVVDVPAIASAASRYVTKGASDRQIERAPAVTLAYVEVAEPDMHVPKSDVERLREAIVSQWQLNNVVIAPALLPEIQPALRKENWRATVAIRSEADGRAVVFAIWPGLHNEAFGVACDVGSTTIALHLVSLLSGAVVATTGSANPQIRFGEDLMSRVSYVMMNPNGREAMTAAVRQAIDGLIGEACESASIARDDVLDAVFVGNPVMHHLLLGIDPTELGQAPFALATAEATSLPANEIGVGMNPGAAAYFLPCVAGHVGADAAAVALAEGPHRQDRQMLVVDVGTNAEIILGNSSRTVAASSPTGPAFEGAEISCGQRAAPGAIERVRIDRTSLEPRFRVIGIEPWSDEPGFAEQAEKVGITGLCGSGIIEVIAEMFLSGIVSADGVVDGSLAATNARVVAQGRTHSYVLHDGTAAGGPVIAVTQTDVRAVQLAKAALYAGIKLLMARAGLEKVDEIRLAGAFGTHIDPVHATVLGLVPDCDLELVSAVGNAAGTGARMALLNAGHRREIEALVRRIEKVETAVEPGFQDEFVAAMAFPNKRDSFEHLAGVVTLPLPGPKAAEQAGGRRGRAGRRRSAAAADA